MFQKTFLLWHMKFFLFLVRGATTVSIVNRERKLDDCNLRLDGGWRGLPEAAALGGSP